MGKRIVIPGGTGFLGRALAQFLRARGDEVVVLTRGPGSRRDDVLWVPWDAATLGRWVDHLDGADAIVHLTGKRVDCRPTRRNIAELVSSRVVPVRLVGDALERVRRPPPVWVQSSTLAIYGDAGDEVITEATPVTGIGPPQMVQVALAWEAAFREASDPVERAVLLRIGVTFGGPGDPATARLGRLVRLGMGGRVAGGTQWLSWVALDDVLRGFARAIDDPRVRGLYHLTSPAPVTNDEAMATFRRLLRRRIGLPSPAWLTRLGAPLLGSDAQLALTGRRAYPARLLDQGFEFRETDFARVVRAALAPQLGARGERANQ